MPFDPVTGLQPIPGLNGDSVVLAVDRAVNELKHGRFIALVDGRRALVAAALETATPESVERIRRFTSDAALILTAERATALGAGIAGPVRIDLAALGTGADLRRAAGLDGSPDTIVPAAAARAWPGSLPLLTAAFGLAKVARVIPALVGVETGVPVADGSIARIDLASIEQIAGSTVPALQRISESRVPLVDAEESVVTLFRDPFGGAEHIAVTIGSPDYASSVPVRLHSACLTGDVLGSLRCDCGDQLKAAVRRITALGGGVLLYLDQEGRGIGLANKLRAYTYQDAGLDTLDADRHLGFRADERSYGVAAAMLGSLGVGPVQLLTNNPQKIAALRELGIDVIGRLSLITSTNVHNERYLRAKRERAGHLSGETGS
jgi:GTP cyclohydrolase II